MRKIESLMNAAITDNATWALDNTTVTLNAGQKLEFQTNQDFMVSSPDAAHPRGAGLPPMEG